MSQTLATPAAPSRALNILAWSLQVLLALVFLAAGGTKLAGVPMMVQVYDLIGVGQWFRIVTGLVEVAGAVALLVPGYAVFAAVWLGCTMVGAVLAHLLVLPTPAAPAVLLLVLCASVAWLRRDQLSTVLGRSR
ncbi:DoxX family protein [Methylobacterium nodulans]|uniref:DoxX family protein n=1 Tax=Methylobacterium nodulans (strain LMG 21967 / CNCM I-2342 / ORS 2060) TaxID=460265 RepID=B8IER0_METNO|nr:DoxX family protein [Methylobacterium nodulans]ACL61403.1 DoxX family protein [Methylobacterium nodulans ORS 2060]